MLRVPLHGIDSIDVMLGNFSKTGIASARLLLHARIASFIFVDESGDSRGCRMRASTAERQEQRQRAASERVRRETSGVLYRLGFPRCSYGCNRVADTIVIAGDGAHLPTAHACALQARRVPA
jgi:hypothetical protein